MALKELLVQLNQAAGVESRLRLAMSLASRHSCRLTALFVGEWSMAQNAARSTAEMGLATARALNVRLLPAVRGIMTRTQGAIMAKAALQLAGVLPHRTLRLPLVAATDEQVETLRADLEEANLL